MNYQHLVLLVISACAGTTLGQVTLIDVDFPNGTGTNPTFLEIDNGVGGTNSWTQSSGVLTTSTTSNSTGGAASDQTIDFPTLGDDTLVLTVNIAPRTGSNSTNGMFIGFQQRNSGGTGADLWNNLPPSFGLVIPGTGSGGNSGGGVPLVANRVSVGGSDPSDSGRYQSPPGYGTTTSASINSGFTVTLSLDNTGWDLVLTGLGIRIQSLGSPIERPQSPGPPCLSLCWSTVHDF